MTEKCDGGPAFPVVRTPTDYHFDGISVRDYFAGQAVIGLYQNNPDIGLGTALLGISQAAERAYLIADAMMEVRARFYKDKPAKS